SASADPTLSLHRTQHRMPARLRTLPRRLVAAACVSALCALAAPCSVGAQGPELTDWSVLLLRRYAVSPNVTCLEVDGWQGKADVYRPARAEGPVPTVIFFHGGGWIRGDKEGPVLHVMPYI